MFPPLNPQKQYNFINLVNRNYHHWLFINISSRPINSKPLIVQVMTLFIDEAFSVTYLLVALITNIGNVAPDDIYYDHQEEFLFKKANFKKNRS